MKSLLVWIGFVVGSWALVWALLWLGFHAVEWSVEGLIP